MELGAPEPKDSVAKSPLQEVYNPPSVGRRKRRRRGRGRAPRGAARQRASKERNNIVPRRDPSGKLPGDAPPPAASLPKRRENWKRLEGDRRGREGRRAGRGAATHTGGRRLEEKAPRQEEERSVPP